MDLVYIQNRLSSMLFNKPVAPGFIGSLFDEFRQIITFSFSPGKLVLPFLTLIGAWGGFPDSPRMFKKLTTWRPFQYFFLWVLVMQGGASVDPGLSLLSVLIFVAITEVIKMIEGPEKFENIEGPKNEDSDEGENKEKTPAGYVPNFMK